MPSNAIVESISTVIKMPFVLFQIQLKNGLFQLHHQTSPDADCFDKSVSVNDESSRLRSFLMLAHFAAVRAVIPATNSSMSLYGLC